jgi:hypothetical protein
MEKISGRRVAHLLLPIALFLAGPVGCEKKSQTAAPASSPTAAPAATAPVRETTVATPPPITGPVTPALVNQEADSITHYLNIPTDPAIAKTDGVVQFYCEVTENGSVETTHALIANNDAFKDPVQKALDWGRFTPATVDGNPVRVYLGGTVLFLHQNEEELIVVSLATHDRDRVGKLANYIQPQLIGGLRHTMERTLSSLTQGILVDGKAEVVVNVDAKGAVTGTTPISESPKGGGLGNLLDGALKKAQFTSAYENGTPAPGGINVVANFSQF